jgi:hypothetical protein
MDKISVTRIVRLDLRFAPVPWAFAQQRRAEIDAHFANARTALPQMWNGRVLLMRDWTVKDGVCSGAYFETDFASMLAWRDFGFPDRDIFNCFGMAALQSADGAYLLGEMAASTANAGRIYFAAGTPEPDDVRDGVVDLAGNVSRELLEETGISVAELEVDSQWTCVRVGQRIALMQPMRSRLTADELRRRMLDHLARDAHGELSDIHIVRGLREVDPSRMPPWITGYFRHLWG